MRRFRSRAARSGLWLLLVLCGAAFGLVRDVRPGWTGAAVCALAAVLVLYVLVETARSGGTGDAGPPAGPVPARTSGDAWWEECQDVEICDHCGAVEARTSCGGVLDLPEGWLALEIDRRGAEVLGRTYCSEEHMRLDLARPLPAPEPFRGNPRDEEPRTAGVRLVGLGRRAVLWLVGGFLLLGCVPAVRFLIGLL